MINIFNEKIFILIWLWFTLLFVASTLDMFYWFSISMFHRHEIFVFFFLKKRIFRDRFRFVLRHLELTSDPDKPELFRKEKRKQVEHFLRTYLKVELSKYSNILYQSLGSIKSNKILAWYINVLFKETCIYFMKG